MKNLKALYEEKVEKNVKKFLDVLDNLANQEPQAIQAKDYNFTAPEQVVTKEDIDDEIQVGTGIGLGKDMPAISSEMEDLIKNTLFPSADVIAQGIKETAERRKEESEETYAYNPLMHNYIGETADEAKAERMVKIEDAKTQAMIDSMLDRAETIYETEPVKAFITWEQFSNHMDNLPEIIDEDFDVILCITRGGLIPAGVASYKLGIKDIVNIKISSYTGTTQGELSIEKLSKKDIKKLKNAKNILVIDDIVDTGETLGELFDYLYNEVDYELAERCSVFSVVTKNPVYNDYYIYNMEDRDEWVVFPWDK